jgi:hypothetical protein
MRRIFFLEVDGYAQGMILTTFIHTWKGEVKWVEQAVPAADTALVVGTVQDAPAADTVSAETHPAGIVPEAAALEAVARSAVE